MENFNIEVDADGIALVTFDVPGRSMNTITMKVMAELPELVERLKTDAAIKGAVLTSGKDNGFCAGADLTELSARAGDGSAKQLFDILYGLQTSLRGLETCGKPVAAAINGLALGGGFEMVLACHYRVAGDDARIQLGLPEGKVGLIPGGGGTQRVSRMIGVMAAAPVLLESKIMRPKEALGAGLINEVVAKGSEVEAAKAWIKAKGDAVQPWDKSGFKIPGGGPYTPQGFPIFMVGIAQIRQKTFGNYPAQVNMMKAVYEGLQLPMDAALRVESRYFVKTMMTPQAKGMIRSLFVSMQELGKGAARPEGVARTDIKKVTVLGAGMMGAGIAYVQAMAGIETVLIDVKQEAADKGRAHVEELLKKRVGRGQMTPEKMAATLALVTATTDYAQVRGSDLVVEAVFENREIKAEVTRKAEAELGETAVFGSNTSTLPITGLAEASVRPERFIGVHFFSPVDKMMLVEIIKGEKTGDEATAAAIDYVLKIKKTPIVVHDSRGFYTSRCFMTFLQEGMEMLIEGVAPAIIDNVGRMTGMPRGPLEMTDDVALDLAHKIVEQTAKDLGPAYTPGLMDALLHKLVVDLGRFGRKNGKGFYDYPDSGSKRLWPGLAEIAPVKVKETDPALVEELKTRLLYRQAVEAARCFEEGVVTDARDADVGAILGWGFAPWTGGPLSMIDAVGAKAFVETCDRLAAAYGPRFTPPKLLREMAAKGERFYGGAASAEAA
jgi:3-hydroxyacyl-CoA dehydrogenase/enoyl-CoA hydratase/3-hydroxybutyryl-CoA epimerase